MRARPSSPSLPAHPCKIPYVIYYFTRSSQHPTATTATRTRSNASTDVLVRNEKNESTRDHDDDDVSLYISLFVVQYYHSIIKSKSEKNVKNEFLLKRKILTDDSLKSIMSCKPQRKNRVEYDCSIKLS